jgi:hypothetical protein
MLVEMQCAPFGALGGNSGTRIFFDGRGEQKVFLQIYVKAV